MIRAYLQNWLHRRRVRAAGERMTTLGPATNSEWYANKSVAYVIQAGVDPPGKYSKLHQHELFLARAKALKPKVWPVRISGVDWYPTIKEWIEVQNNG